MDYFGTHIQLHQTPLEQGGRKVTHLRPGNFTVRAFDQCGPSNLQPALLSDTASIGAFKASSRLSIIVIGERTRKGRLLSMSNYK